jgi:hypothetical protein
MENLRLSEICSFSHLPRVICSLTELTDFWNQDQSFWLSVYVNGIYRHFQKEFLYHLQITHKARLHDLIHKAE